MFKQILKLELTYHGSKFSSLLRQVSKILKFHERVISALKFELSGKRGQILVANSCE